ncbi:MAG: DUF2800 domain-containing protein [Miniphocaeibacter sp.]|uniref:DUF2800 domain-containing protein n=1 Tax=Miniphocaeibacter sp. TaxID=3100973 RepID=UPI003BAE32EF
MNKHALLSPSSSHRWLNCPPSLRLSQQYENTSSSYAAEGTEAHALCEYKLRSTLGIKARDPTANLIYYNEEMEECTSDYATYILELLEDAKNTCSDPLILIEQKVDYSKYAEGGFGTGDCVIVSDDNLHIIDYKHGQGILVEAYENSQLKLYALGALELFDCLYDIDTVSMTVYQPRRSNISTFTIPKEELYKWANEVLKPTAKLAYDGKGEFKCGDWCVFCKIKHECRYRSEYNLELAKYEFQLPPTLEDDDIEEILSKVDGLVSWASDIKDYALQASLRGKQWKDFKLVEGRSNRKYINEDAVVEIVKSHGYDPYEHKIRGITAMEKALGKSRFSELLSQLLEKPKGKPTLVPESDKRPAINTAADDFNEN